MNSNIFRKTYSVSRDLFLDIFFPRLCVGCGREGSHLCFDCAGTIDKFKTPTCPECGRITKFGQYCPACKARTATALTGLIIAARYESGPTKEMIHQLKYSGITELAPLLGELIFERIKDHLPYGQIVIVPVPLHKKREAQRGFNQSELLARYLSDRLGFPGGAALMRTEDTRSQVELSGEERRENLRGKFAIADAELVSGKTVLLVDDVMTTGSTLNECAKVLRRAGARQVWGTVIARG
ncbi:MAG: ComF family protein [Patescibacteria group bacterium]